MKKILPVDNIVDGENNISLDLFKRYSYSDIEELTSINPNCEVEKYEVEKLQYFKIRNFLQNPEDLKKFLIQFPCEDRMKSITEDGKTEIVSQAPGFQQIFSSYYYKNISRYFHNLLIKENLCHYQWQTHAWDFYTNCIYSGMKSYNKNYLPHIDEFSYAANIFLTDVKNTATSFFKYKGIDKNFYNLKELIRDKKELEYYKSYIRKKTPENEKILEWPLYEGDENFIKYHSVPSEYNCVSMYKGNFWHSIYFNAGVPNSIRYSLVGVLKK